MNRNMTTSRNTARPPSHFHEELSELYQFHALMEQEKEKSPSGLTPSPSADDVSTGQCPLCRHRQKQDASMPFDIASRKGTPELSKDIESCSSLSSSSSSSSSSELEPFSNDSSDDTFCCYESSSVSSSSNHSTDTSYRIPAGYQNLTGKPPTTGLLVPVTAGQNHDRSMPSFLEDSDDKRWSLLKHSSDSSPWTKATKSCSSSSSSNSSSIDLSSYRSGSSISDNDTYNYESSLGSDSSTASYQELNKELANTSISSIPPTSSTSPVMSPQELIDMLKTVNDTVDTPQSHGFLTARDKAPRLLQVEELTDLLCYVNASEEAKVETNWNAIYNVVHGQVEEECCVDFPFPEIQIPTNEKDDDCSIVSTLSMGSCKPNSLRLDYIEDR